MYRNRRKFYYSLIAKKLRSPANEFQLRKSRKMQGCNFFSNLKKCTSPANDQKKIEKLVQNSKRCRVRVTIEIKVYFGVQKYFKLQKYSHYELNG